MLITLITQKNTLRIKLLCSLCKCFNTAKILNMTKHLKCMSRELKDDFAHAIYFLVSPYPTYVAHSSRARPFFSHTIDFGNHQGTEFWLVQLLQL